MGMICQLRYCDAGAVDGSFCDRHVPALITSTRRALAQRHSASDNRARGFIYFIQSGVDGPVKVGYSAARPEKRLAELQTGNPETLRLLGYVGGSEHLERHLHRVLHLWRRRGEWFAPGRDLAFMVRLGGHKIRKVRV